MTENLDEHKAGAAAVDPDDFNILIDAVVTLQGGNGGSLPDWFMTGTASPQGAVTPAQKGALYKDLGTGPNQGALYVAVGETDTDWYCIGGDGDANIPGVSWDSNILIFAPDYDGTGAEVQGAAATGGAAGVFVPYSDSNNRFQAIALKQVSPALGLINNDGPIPTTTLSSGTGAQIDISRDVETHTPVTLTSAAGTCKAELAPVQIPGSPPDPPNYFELFTVAPKVDAAVVDVCVRVPAGWYLKLTVTNATLGTTSYY